MVKSEDQKDHCPHIEGNRRTFIESVEENQLSKDVIKMHKPKVETNAKPKSKETREGIKTMMMKRK